MSGATSSHLKLLAPTAEDARLVRLVTTHAGLLDALEVVDGAKELQLITRDGAALRGSNTICKYIAQSSAAGENLLGGDDDGRALVRLQAMGLQFLLNSVRLTKGPPALAGGAVAVHTVLHALPCQRGGAAEAGRCAAQPHIPARHHAFPGGPGPLRFSAPRCGAPPRVHYALHFGSALVLIWGHTSITSILQYWHALDTPETFKTSLQSLSMLLCAQKSFPSAQLGRLKNIVRWYDYLQHVADPRGIFPKVPFKRPRLSLAPPAVAAPQQKVGAFRMHGHLPCGRLALVSLGFHDEVHARNLHSTFTQLVAETTLAFRQAQDASAAPAAKQGGAAVVGTPAAAGPPAGPASAAPAAPPKAAAASAQPAPAPAAKVRERRCDAGMCSWCGMLIFNRLWCVEGGPLRARRLAVFLLIVVCPAQHCCGSVGGEKGEGCSCGAGQQGCSSGRAGGGCARHTGRTDCQGGAASQRRVAVRGGNRRWGREAAPGESLGNSTCTH